MKFFAKSCCFVVLLAISGCDRADREVQVEGTVNYNGQPVATGQIQFLSEQDVPTQLKIVDGRFSGGLPKGEMLVRIWGDRIVKLDKPIVMADNPNPITETYVPFVPKKFNVESTLKQAISPETNLLTFNLED